MKISKCEIFAVEVPIDATLTKINIRLNTVLKGKSILGLEAFTNDSLTVSPKGNAVVDKDLFRKGILVLNADGVESIQLPLSVLKRVNSNSAGDAHVISFTEFIGQRIDWEKSYIQFGSAVDTSAFAATDFVFLAHY